MPVILVSALVVGASIASVYGNWVFGVIAMALYAIAYALLYAVFSRWSVEDEEDKL